MGTRRFLALAILVLTLAALSGCGLWPQLTAVLTARPAEGHPSPSSGELRVEFSFSEDSNRLFFDPGNGSSSQVYAARTGQPFCSHIYRFRGDEIPDASGRTTCVYRATATANGRRAYADVTLYNTVPTVFLPEIGTGSGGFTWWGAVYYYAGFIRHYDCSSHESWDSGAVDPDNDPIASYRWIVTGPDKNRETVFYAVWDTHGRNITGQLVLVADYASDEAGRAIVVIGLGAPTLEEAQQLNLVRDFGYPVTWDRGGQVTALGTCPPLPPPPAPTYFGDMITTLAAADSTAGGEGSLTWTQAITRGTGGCWDQ